MKFAKLSLVAIMAMGVSAFADVQNIKVSGDAKLYYHTQDDGGNDLFDRASGMGQAGLDLSVSADLANGVAGKMSITALNTLGLENNLVSAVWEAGLGNQWWVSEAWLAKSFGKTTFKIGRQELDTPLAFSEKWSIAENTFDAAVVLNQDIPKTTLVAAWVGRGNGNNTGNDRITNALSTLGINNANEANNINDIGVRVAGGIGLNFAADGADPFETYYSDGAYAAGVVTTAIPMTTAQAWYYDVVNVAQAYWLQADVTPIKGLTVGAQFANVDAEDAGLKNDTSAWALKAGYELNGLSLSASYSSVDDGDVYIANTATNYLGGSAQTKLYTEVWWNYGNVGAPDTDAWNLTAEYSLKNVADFGLYYTGTSTDNRALADLTEITLTASKSFGNLDTTLAYIYTDYDIAGSDEINTIQVYLTYNF